MAFKLWSVILEGSSEKNRDDRHNVAGRTIGHYVVESQIGRGGMGEVYLARDTRLPRHVAIKRIAAELRHDPDYRRRFQEEAEKAIRISDHRIAGVFDVLEETDEIFLVMEYVPGPSLRQRLQDRIDVASFLPLAIECTEALAAAHRSGIVHRDVKPENYVIDPVGAIKLLDLGVAKAIPRADEDSTAPLGPAHTQPTLIGGTPEYMAPEALLGLRSDFRSDIFSLGVMFYEMLSGQHPFHANTRPGIQDRILHEEPKALSTLVSPLPSKLEDLVTRMVAKDPERRPATARDVLHDLLEIEPLDPVVALSPAAAPGLLGDAAAVAPTRFFSRAKSPIRRVLQPRVLSIFGICSLALVAAVIVGKLLFAPPARLPEDLRVRLLTFTATHGSQESRIMAAGITATLEQALRRLTNAQAFPTDSRAGRPFQPLYTVTRDPVRPRTTLALSGDLTLRQDRIEVRMELRNVKDSLLLRSAQASAPRDDGLTLFALTLQAATRMLELDITSEELTTVWRPATRDKTAFRFELQALGYLLEADARDIQDRTTSKIGSSGEPEARVDPVRIRAAFLDSAQAAYERACTRDSMDADAWFGRALVQWEKRQDPQLDTVPPMVPAWCQRALQIDLNHAQSHALLGECYAAANRDLAAIAELARAVALNPSDYLSVLALAKLYQKNDRYEELQSLYWQQMRRFPRTYYWFSWNATSHFRRAEYDSAAAYYQKALDREPDEESALAGMGATCLMQGRYETAIPYLRASIAQRPSALRYSNLGTVLFLTRRLAAAESAYTKAISINPNYYMLWGNLGDSRFWNPEARSRAADAYGQAIELATDALEKSPQDPLIMARLAFYQIMVGDVGAGRALLQKALAHDGDHDVLYKAALAYSRLGESDSAFVYLQRALDAGYSPLWVKETPELDDLRDDTRLEQLQRRQE